MKQTAVEWLVEQLIPKAMFTYDATTYNAVQQAKAMEKEQILKALYFGKNINDDIEAEQYYNETYKNK
jgi:hypothetical protein